MKDTFATAFNCMDGRCQEAVRSFVCTTWDIVYVDTVTEPGIDGILAGKRLLSEQPSNLVEWIRRKAEISAKGHGSSHAVVVGHTKCAGNNVLDSVHVEDIERAVETVRAWNLFKEVVGLIAFESAEGWDVCRLEDFSTNQVIAV